MSSNRKGVSDVPDRVLPLPARPNLEFERKRARQILRAIHAGDADALYRVRRYRSNVRATSVKLADVQLTVARDYGFPSWPRLVAYYVTWNRHEQSGPRFQSYGPSHWNMRVGHIIHGHGRRQPFAVRALASFVPRFNGRSDAEILSAPVTQADAQLAVARMQRFPSWEALLEYSHDEPRDPSMGIEAQMKASLERRYGAPFAAAMSALKRRDLASLSRLIDAHPELLQTPSLDKPGTSSLLRSALLFERNEPGAETRAVSDWLVTRGADLATTLNRMLLERIHVKTADVAFLLERGADPNWLQPNGLTVLEHALLRYWNPEAVDLIASRVTPRPAFWIAAGLGDVPGMLRFLDRHGRPTSAARRNRPDFTAVGLEIPSHPDADDLEIVWEAFCVAGFNQRLAALDALLDRGFPIDHAPWGSTLLEWAEGNRVTALADYLVMRGARRASRSPVD